MIKKIFLFLILFLISSQVWATTYFVRTDGGNRSQCTGTVDAPYSGSGTAQPCALIHPWLVLGWIDGGTVRDTGMMVAGDTLKFSKSGDDFKISYDGYLTAIGSAPSGCSGSFKYDCHNYPPPSGTDSTHRTIIQGFSQSSYTELTGGNNINQGVLYLGGEKGSGVAVGHNHIEIDYLSIDDHDPCDSSMGANPPTPSCTDAARSGIRGRGNDDIYVSYTDVHGIGGTGFQIQGASNWTWFHVNVLRNGYIGMNFDVDNSGDAAMDSTGTFTFSHSRIGYSGCGETYPGLLPTQCWGQSGSHAGNGDGTGWGNTRNGNWIITDSMIDHNTQDGFDGYHNFNVLDSVHSARTVYEGNAGQQFKGNNTFVSENDFFVGNCNYFNGQSFTYSGFSIDDMCRAEGNTIFLGLHAGIAHKITGATLLSFGDVGIVSEGSSCDGTTKITTRNSILRGGRQWHDDQSIFVSGGNDTSSIFYTVDDGGCASNYYDEDYNQIYGWKEGAGAVTGAHSRLGDPIFSGTVNVGPGAIITDYANADDVRALMYLSATSPSRYSVTGANTADESLTSGETSDLTIDYNSCSRGSNWDGGAVQYGSDSSCSGVVIPPVTISSITKFLNGSLKIMNIRLQ